MAYSDNQATIGTGKTEVEAAVPRVNELARLTRPGSTMQSSTTALFDELERFMLSTCFTLDMERNPVARLLPTVSTVVLRRVLLQYSFFSRDIVSLLERARSSLGVWETVRVELDRNICEELGSSTAGVPHYELLRQGILEEYRVDLATTRADPQTTEFIAFCYGCMIDHGPAYTAGSVYALEATASAEITVLQHLACELSIRELGRPIPRKGLLFKFLHCHVHDFEPEHKRGLEVALAACLGELQFGAFTEGFRVILGAMDRWWSALAVDSNS